MRKIQGFFLLVVCMAVAASIGVSSPQVAAGALFALTFTGITGLETRRRPEARPLAPASREPIVMTFAVGSGMLIMAERNGRMITRFVRG